MRRKNWINKKKLFYDNVNIIDPFFFNFFLKKKEFKFDEYNTKGQLYKVFLKKNKESLLLPTVNFYFYNDFIKNIKFISRNIIYKNYAYKTNNILVLSPSFMFKSQFFINKTLFDDLLLALKLKGFFVHKNFFKYQQYKCNLITYKKHLIGYNYYVIKSNLTKFSELIKINDDKEYNSVGKVKFFLENPNTNNYLHKNLNLFFIYNIYMMNVLEIYKILIYVFISKVCV